MYRFLTPLLALVVAVSLFVTFIKPTFNEYKAIDTEIGDYEQALKRAQELQNRINELIAERNAIPQSGLERLEDLLPSSLDEVSIVLSLDAISARHGLVLGGIDVKSVRTDPEGNARSAKNAASGEFMFEDEQVLGDEANSSLSHVTNAFNTVELSFSVTGEYEAFKTFLTDIERSLALMDVSSLTIEEPVENELSTYTLGVTMYEFKPSTK